MWLLLFAMTKISMALPLPPQERKVYFRLHEKHKKNHEIQRKIHFKEWKKKHRTYQKLEKILLNQRLKKRDGKSSDLNLKKEWEKKQMHFQKIQRKDKNQYLKKRKQKRKEEKRHPVSEFPFL